MSIPQDAARVAFLAWFERECNEDSRMETPESRIMAWRAWQAARKTPEQPDVGIPISSLGQCWCTTCRPITLEDARFVVCPDCGNKRCPKSHNHELACTNSNAPGQTGSSWEHVKPLG